MDRKGRSEAKKTAWRGLVMVVCFTGSKEELERKVKGKGLDWQSRGGVNTQ
jgi:hypothetical protein